MDKDKITRVRLLHAEQDHLDHVQIARAVGLPPHVTKLIMEGHPWDDVTPEQIMAVMNADGATVGEIASETGVPVLVVNAALDGLYDGILPPGWDLI